MTKDWKKKRRFRKKLARTLQQIINKPSLEPPYDGPVKSIIILAQEKFGDAILLTPLLKNLKKHFPATEIHLVTFSKATTAFFRYDRHVDAVHFLKGSKTDYIKNVLGRSFDVLFNTKDHPSTSFLLQSLFIRSRCKVGIANEFHTGLYDYLVEKDFHSPIALKNCGFCEILGKPVSSEACRPYLPAMPVSKQVRQFLDIIPLRVYCGINISAGWPTRCWKEEKWKIFINSFPKERFLVLCSPEDIEQKKRLDESCVNVIPSPVTSNLYEAGLITAKLKILVTPDTAMIHVASTSNTPITGLYGKAPQDQSRFKPFMIDYRMIVSPTALVRDIPLDEVTDIFREFLELRKRKTLQERHENQ